MNDTRKYTSTHHSHRIDFIAADIYRSRANMDWMKPVFFGLLVAMPGSTSGQVLSVV